MLNQVEEFDINSKSMPAISTHVHDIRIEDLLGREPIRTEDPAIRSVIRGQVVMITGAAGSIGSEIVRQVAAMKAGHIVLLDQAETPMHDMRLEMEQKPRHQNTPLHRRRRQPRPHGPCFPEISSAICIPCRSIQARAYDGRNPQEAILTNVFGTKNIADLSVKYGVEKFVMVSTDKAVNPTNVMGASKRIAEIYRAVALLPPAQTDRRTYRTFITTRFGNVLRSNGSVIPLFRKQIEQGGPITINTARLYVTS